MTSPCALRIGAATAVSPTSSSSTATAYPCSRTSASSRRSAERFVTVSLVNAGSSCSTSSSWSSGSPDEQHLAVAGRVQGDVLADPVVRLERGRAGDLVEVERGRLGQDRDVDRLAGVGGQPLADRPSLLHDVEPGGGGAGQPEQARCRGGTCRGRRSARPGRGVSSGRSAGRRCSCARRTRRATSVTPTSPRRARTSRMVIARSTDWTPPPDPTALAVAWCCS